MRLLIVYPSRALKRWSFAVSIIRTSTLCILWKASVILYCQRHDRSFRTVSVQCCRCTNVSMYKCRTLGTILSVLKSRTNPAMAFEVKPVSKKTLLASRLILYIWNRMCIGLLARSAKVNNVVEYYRSVLTLVSTTSTTDWISLSTVNSFACKLKRASLLLLLK